MTNLRTRLFEMSPSRFYAITGIMKSIKPETMDWLDEQCASLKELSLSVQEVSEKLDKSVRSMDGEVRASIRRKAPKNLDEYEDIGKELPHSSGMDTNFLRVAQNVVSAINLSYGTLNEIAQSVKPGELVLFRQGDSRPKDHQDMQAMLGEIDLNHSNVKRFIEGCTQLESAEVWLSDIVNGVESVFGMYHRALIDRHSTQGIQIHKDPVLTDIAITLYENIDAHGEIADGKKPNEVSAYTVRKAEVLANSLKDEFLHSLTERPDKLNDIVSSSFLTMQTFVRTLKVRLSDPLGKIMDVLGERRVKAFNGFVDQLGGLNDLSPMTVIYKDKNVLMTSDERFNLEFKNETIKQIVELIRKNDLDIKDLVNYVLERKQALRKYFQEENSFYVCRISAGNPFLGEAPGALQVIPGTRPNVNMDEIVGSGFAEVKDFASTIEESSKFHDLFVATSPSKSADKSNVLMIGPMGCLAGGTFIRYEVRGSDGRRINHKGGSIESLFKRFNRMEQDSGGSDWTKDATYFVSSVNDEGRIIQNRILGVIATGEKECFELTVRGGEKITATADHKFFVGDGYVELSELRQGMSVFVHRNVYWRSGNPSTRANKRVYLYIKHHPICGTKLVDGLYEYKRLARSRAVVEARMNRMSLESYVNCLNEGRMKGLQFLARDMHVHHKDENIRNDDEDNLQIINGIVHNREHRIENHNSMRYEAVEDEIVSIVPAGVQKTFDLKMAAPFHNYIANGIVVHNCGKSEVLRAVGGDKKSIAIFAQGSDFNTCWRGEMEKNPKRLFEQAVRLQKESGRHVHICIDEIDSILNSDKEPGATNLNLEFQILMDGVVSYPNLSVWGATNNVERIPMPMIRRFSKILVVGELNQEDRVTLLRSFFSYLPLSDVNDQHFEGWAKKLNGATGDVIRKIADVVWRKKVSAFTRSSPKEAEVVQNFLNRGEQRFQISEFKPEDRKAFKVLLGLHMKVTPEDVDDSVRANLRNIGVLSEIETARETYTNAKRYLAHLANTVVQ